MAGHSKWANIKHRKAAVDKKRGKIWSKISRAILAAARQGGGDPEMNLTLRYAIDEARYANMPKDTIKRLVDKGSGAGTGESWETIRYEGYGPAGVAVLVDTLTDNKNRTVTDVRTAFTKNGGNLGTGSCVSYLFESRGQILIEGSNAEEETLMELAIDAGAEDVQAPEGEDGMWTVLTDPGAFLTVKDAVEGAGIAIAEAEIAMIPETMIEVGPSDARKLMNLIDALEDSDDVQKVYTNSELTDEAMALLE